MPKDRERKKVPPKQVRPPQEPESKEEDLDQSSEVEQSSEDSFPASDPPAWAGKRSHKGKKVA